MRAARSRRRTSSHHGVRAGVSCARLEIEDQTQRRKRHFPRPRRGEPQQIPDGRKYRERGENQRSRKGEREAEHHGPPDAEGAPCPASSRMRRARSASEAGTIRTMHHKAPSARRRRRAQRIPVPGETLHIIVAKALGFADAQTCTRIDVAKLGMAAKRKGFFDRIGDHHEMAERATRRHPAHHGRDVVGV